MEEAREPHFFGFWLDFWLDLGGILASQNGAKRVQKSMLKFDHFWKSVWRRLGLQNTPKINLTRLGTGSAVLFKNRWFFIGVSMFFDFCWRILSDSWGVLGASCGVLLASCASKIIDFLFGFQCFFLIFAIGSLGNKMLIFYWIWRSKMDQKSIKNRPQIDPKSIKNRGPEGV